MANLTLSIDEKLLQAARVRAVKEGTSVNEICRKAIESYARAWGEDRLARFDTLLEQIDANRPEGGPVPVPWTNREEMYEQILRERHPTLMGKQGRGKR